MNITNPTVIVSLAAGALVLVGMIYWSIKSPRKPCGYETERIGKLPPPPRGSGPAGVGAPVGPSSGPPIVIAGREVPES